MNYTGTAHAKMGSFCNASVLLLAVTLASG
jgi:hypothetical protein